MGIMDFFKQPVVGATIPGAGGTAASLLSNWRSVLPQFRGATGALGATVGLPAAYATGASMLQKNLPESLTGKGGLAEQNPYFGGMGVAVDPEVEKILRAGNKNVPVEETVTPPGVFPESENLIPPFMEEPSGVGEGYDKQGLWDRIKGAPLGIINALTGRQGATESFGGYPGGAESRAGLFPREVQNLQRLADQGYLAGQGQDVFGTNVVSQFGDYDEAMDKNLGVFEKTMAQKGYKDLDELEEYYSKTYGPKSYILNKLRHVKGWQGQGPKVPPVDTRDIPGKEPTVWTPAGGAGGDPGRPGSPSYATKAGAEATYDRPGAKGSPGYHWSQGGRVGYNKGGRVGILSIF